MVHDVWGQSGAHEHWQYVPPTYMPEPPFNESQQFYNLLEASKSDLWEGCDYSKLSTNARIMTMKSIGEIHCCKKGCMIYWREDENRTECKVCGQARFKDNGRSPFKKMYYFPLGPRLRRLYASGVTAQSMRWHAEHAQTAGERRHPADSIAWKTFDKTHPLFASESRNVKLALSTDGFQPFGQSGSQYSLWSEERFLNRNHRFRKDKKNFIKNITEHSGPPSILNGEEILDNLEQFECKRVFDEEKNIFDNIFNTIMNVEGKTKDNANARRDLEELGIRPELWPCDGCIDMKKHKLYGMKSHDCHVFMQLLLPIGLRELLPHGVWEPLIELSNFFRDLIATVIREADMTKYMSRLTGAIPRDARKTVNRDMRKPLAHFSCKVICCKEELQAMREQITIEVCGEMEQRNEASRAELERQNAASR
ncbi:hypothetical protein SASPL_108492 [Salvia splendens]|uniref:Transposase n=1 Tax=Salvia splendens TaxID=180675 RepID=A0A8X8YID2_SALSN|nr:hypothetical protein SASPL_108492 [Salvia splendens]